MQHNAALTLIPSFYGEAVDGSLMLDGWRGGAGARALLDLDRQMTAIVAMSDPLALGAMAAVRERGLSVPDDVSVVGFDDISAADVSDPPLTTVRQPDADKGAAASLSGPRGTCR